MKYKKKKALPHMKPTTIGEIGGLFCITCSKWKTIDKFNKNKRIRLGYTLKCKDCIYEYVRNHQRYKKYNITESEFRWLEKKQDNKCKICNKTFGRNTTMRHIDHNHETNEVRGLLCVNCNLGIGNFKENIDFLNKAIYYLQTTARISMKEEINEIFLSELDKSLGPNDFLDR